MSAPQAERATADAKAFDAATPVGTPVFFWPWGRDGAGRPSRTRGAAWVLCGTPVVSVEDYSGGIALTHVQVAGADEWAAAKAAIEAAAAEKAAAEAAVPTLPGRDGVTIGRDELIDVVRAQLGRSDERDEEVVDVLLTHLATTLAPTPVS